ncbi:WG repeat-containing protein [Eisenibacter elegans]|uniref:WG repeat-containing protein n=1 Tax=Eisenibacter elegans TaxID=997 RepID=UPI0004135C94|nr:WG repeat-containing protein [Eisenibacter elegans]
MLQQVSVRWALALCLLLIQTATYAQTLYPFPNDDGLWGYVDHTGAYQIAPQYLGASLFVEGRAFVTLPSDVNQDLYLSQITCIDHTGKVYYQWPMAGNTAGMLLLNIGRYLMPGAGLITKPYVSEETSVNQQYVYYDYNSGMLRLSITTECTYMCYATAFDSGRAFIGLNDSTKACIDLEGNIRWTVSTPANGVGDLYQSAFDGGIAVQHIEKAEWGEWQIIDIDGKVVFYPLDTTQWHIDEISHPSEGYCFVVAYAKTPSNKELDYTELAYFIVNLNTRQVSPLKDLKLHYSSPITYVIGYEFSEGLALVQTYSGELTNGIQQTYIRPDGSLVEFDPTTDALGYPQKTLFQQTEYENANLIGGLYKDGLAPWVVYRYTDTNTEYKVFYIDNQGKAKFVSGWLKE